MEQTDKLTAIRGCAKRLKLSWLMSNINDALIETQKQSPSYDDFLLHILNEEVAGREYRLKLLRYKNARLPMAHYLDQYDFSISNGLSSTQLNQLRELHWVEEGFNLMLAGPSGVGKTYIAAGLCADAIEKGYKAYFRSMPLNIVSICHLSLYISRASSALQYETSICSSGFPSLFFTFAPER